MELNISSLQDSGSFTGRPVEKEIKWKQGDNELSATTFVRKLSYRSVVSDARQYGKEIIAGRIAACICDKHGVSVFTVEDITGIPSYDDPVDKEGDDEDTKKANAKVREKNKKIIERGPLNHNITLALLGAIREVNSISGEAET